MSRSVLTLLQTVVIAVSSFVGLLTVAAIEMSAQSASSGDLALYASDGAKLTHYEVSADQATLTERESVTLEGSVQYAWPAPSGHHLYVVWSSGGAGKVSAGIAAYDIEPGTGNLTQHGDSVPLKYRPINTTLDRDGTHLLVVSNAPSGLTVYNINPDGGIGAEVKEPDNLEFGIYVHQVHIEPSNQTAIIVARGNYKHVPAETNPLGAQTTDPGGLHIFDYKDGVLTSRTVIAPTNGIDFSPRHLEFDKAGKFAFVSLEAQNRLDVFSLAKDGTPSSTPIFSVPDVASPDNIPVEHQQESGALHFRPDGKFLYVVGRGIGQVPFQGKQVAAKGAENIVAVFEVNPKTGQPKLIQITDTHGFVPRTFSIDPSGRILVVGNQNTRLVRDGDTVKSVAANLAVFRIKADGKLEFVRTYDVGGDGKAANLFWMSMVPSSSY